MRTAATGTTCRRRELVQDAEGGAPCGPGENRGACQRIDEARGGSGRGDSFARYAASRSVPLLVTVLIAIGVHSRMAIAFLGIAMTSVQAFDGVIGALAHDPSKTYGPFAFAVLNALAVGWLLRGQESHAKSP